MRVTDLTPSLTTLPFECGNQWRCLVCKLWSCVSLLVLIGCQVKRERDDPIEAPLPVTKLRLEDDSCPVHRLVKSEPMAATPPTEAAVGGGGDHPVAPVVAATSGPDAGGAGAGGAGGSRGGSGPAVSEESVIYVSESDHDSDIEIVSVGGDVGAGGGGGTDGGSEGGRGGQGGCRLPRKAIPLDNPTITSRRLGQGPAPAALESVDPEVSGAASFWRLRGAGATAQGTCVNQWHLCQSVAGAT